MSKIVDINGKEMKSIPEEHIASTLVHLTGAVHCLLANHDVFQILMAHCDLLDQDELKKVIMKDAEESLTDLDVDSLVEQLTHLMKIYKHISPILSLYAKKIITEEQEDRILVPDNGLIH